MLSVHCTYLTCNLIVLSLDLKSILQTAYKYILSKPQYEYWVYHSKYKTIEGTLSKIRTQYILFVKFINDMKLK